jgi:hypothetical protein
MSVSMKRLSVTSARSARQTRTGSAKQIFQTVFAKIDLLKCVANQATGRGCDDNLLGSVRSLQPSG